MSAVWMLVGLIVVLVLGIAGLVLMAMRDMPEEMSERWRQENERDRGKQ